MIELLIQFIANIYNMFKIELRDRRIISDIIVNKFFNGKMRLIEATKYYREKLKKDKKR